MQQENRAGVPPQRSAPPEEHLISMAEKGPFCSAACTCGWRGPARRARSLARRDAAAHQEA
ncbi:hypothetical protein F0L17_11625 [Streptomyces sp. TRM43335]|uniref:Uncharacterized protein n=1 Tax=Streptomyces taklimakanensis TaxID=2569853 RepID=A0A6G2BCY2_9ACTN|nr:hypothetical protein [Streptomyces taklimakanensis]MTE19762.1 hypothetical protein [Streptomyces taklimakanensis]